MIGSLSESSHAGLKTMNRIFAPSIDKKYYYKGIDFVVFQKWVKSNTSC